MDKLELKHLAPYLPYKLKAEMLDYKIDYVGMKYDTVIGFHQWDSRDLYWSVLTMGGSKPELNSIKPILRPLSDLTEIFYWDNLQDGDCELNRERINEIKNSPRGHLKLYQSNYLFKHHFDIFGLIEKGLAIDINTLQS